MIHVGVVLVGDLPTGHQFRDVCVRAEDDVHYVRGLPLPGGTADEAE